MHSGVAAAGRGQTEDGGRGGAVATPAVVRGDPQEAGRGSDSARGTDRTAERRRLGEQPVLMAVFAGMGMRPRVGNQRGRGKHESML